MEGGWEDLGWGWGFLYVHFSFTRMRIIPAGGSSQGGLRSLEALGGPLALEGVYNGCMGWIHAPPLPLNAPPPQTSSKIG
jgi:hypothetical protein